MCVPISFYCWFEVKPGVNLYIDERPLFYFPSVLTLSEVLPKPVETGNDELAEKFKTYLKNGSNLSMLPITETIGETAGVLRGKYPHLKTVDVRPLFISRTLNSPPIIPLVLLGAVHHATPQGSKRHPF